MKYFIALLSLFTFSIQAFSQSQPSYADFLQKDAKIQWAAEYDQLIEITPLVKKFGITEILSKQIQKNGAVVNYHIENGTLTRSTSFTVDSFRSDINYSFGYAPYNKYFLQSNAVYDTSPFIENEKKCACDGSLHKNKFDIYKIKQLIYYKNAKLYVKNILVTPVCLKRVIDSQDSIIPQFVWQSAYSSCYNNGQHGALTAAVKSKCIDLGNSEAVYDLSYDINDTTNTANILTKGNPGFSHHLYQDITDGKVTAVDPMNYSVISSKSILQYGVPDMEVPVFDSVGVQIGMDTVHQEVNLDSFYLFNINQHFYFDTANNILYSTVNYINVYKRIITSQGVYLGTMVFYRVYFVDPKLYKKPVIKTFLN
ncbi:MAG TPA: hypothetical protein VK559_04220 [Ferruginibacter sp.]|nr:hypothetical protein [Ferruginibacter sp.]